MPGMGLSLGPLRFHSLAPNYDFYLSGGRLWRRWLIDTLKRRMRMIGEGRRTLHSWLIIGLSLWWRLLCQLLSITDHFHLLVSIQIFISCRKLIGASRKWELAWGCTSKRLAHFWKTIAVLGQTFLRLRAIQNVRQKVVYRFRSHSCTLTSSQKCGFWGHCLSFR